MPYDGIPIRCNKHCPTALPQNAERLGKNAINIGDVLGDLRAYNDIKRSVGHGYSRRISNRIRKPFRRASPPAQRNKVARNIDAGDSALATNNVSNAFAQKPGTTADIQHALAERESKLLDCLRSL